MNDDRDRNRDTDNDEDFGTAGAKDGVRGTWDKLSG